MRPLLLFSVLWVFFTKIGHVNDGTKPGEKYYGAQLLGRSCCSPSSSKAQPTRCAAWWIARTSCADSLPAFGDPAVGGVVGVFNLALNLIVVAIFAISAGVRPMLSWLELPLIVGALILFATGMAMLLSALFVHFRDIQPIWEVVCPDSLLRLAGDHLDPDGDHQIGKTRRGTAHHVARHIYMLNPLAVIFQQFRTRDDHQRHPQRRRSAGQLERAVRGRWRSWWRSSSSASWCSTARRRESRRISEMSAFDVEREHDIVSENERLRSRVEAWRRSWWRCSRAPTPRSPNGRSRPTGWTAGTSTSTR